MESLINYNIYNDLSIIQLEEIKEHISSLISLKKQEEERRENLRIQEELRLQEERLLQEASRKSQEELLRKQEEINKRCKEESKEESKELSPDINEIEKFAKMLLDNKKEKENIVFNFGKQKGKKVMDVCKNDPSYINWLYSDKCKMRIFGETKDAIMAYLIVKRFSKSKDCPVCLGNKPSFKLNCDHYICFDCVKQMFLTESNRKRLKCPLCRDDSTPNPGSSIDELLRERKRSYEENKKIINKFIYDLLDIDENTDISFKISPDEVYDIEANVFIRGELQSVYFESFIGLIKYCGKQEMLDFDKHRDLKEPIKDIFSKMMMEDY